MSTRLRTGFGLRRLTPPATPSTDSTFTKSSRRHLTNSSPGKKPNISYFRVFGSKCFILIKRGRKSKFAPKAIEGFLLGYDSNTREYRVFNKSTGLVEVSCDIVFDETNGSQVEQVDLDELDDEEAQCVALRNCNALNLGVEFFLLFSHQIRALLSFLFLFRSFFLISNQYGDRCPCHV
jgi:hypothetical protein